MGYGDRLREERLRLGLTVVGLAERCGCAKNSQINYEGEKTSPAAVYWERAAAIGVNVCYVLTGQRSGQRSGQEVVVTHTVDRLSTDEEEWLDWYRQMRHEDRELIVPMVRQAAERAAPKRRRVRVIDARDIQLPPPPELPERDERVYLDLSDHPEIERALKEREQAKGRKKSGGGR